ncbi:MAG: methionine biosynthesis protein MetW [Pseudomonadota bacterium]
MPAKHPTTASGLPDRFRADYLAIASRVPTGARVLDVGCGSGELLALLRETKGVDGRGLELQSDLAGRALAKGLSVVQGDAAEDLELFPDNAFDVAILSKTVQQMRQPAHILAELARIAPEIIVSFQNHGQWSRRLSFVRQGRMPGPKPWHSDDMLHPCTAIDMTDLAAQLNLSVIAMAPVRGSDVGAFRTRGLSRLNWNADEVILHMGRHPSGGRAP